MLGSRRRSAAPFAAPLGPDPDALRRGRAPRDGTARAAAELDELVGDRKLHRCAATASTSSKNIVRGFLAYDQLLDDAPRVARARGVRRHAQPRRARTWPSTSRTSRRSTQAAARVNERWGTGDWQPVVVDTRDDYERSVAGFARYDVLLVNPVKDGLNLVAKEGPLVNRRDGVLLPLTRGGRVRRSSHDAVLAVHPYDIEQGAHALHAALVDARRRARRHARRGSASSPRCTRRAAGSTSCSATPR